MNYTIVFFIILLFGGLVVDVGYAEWQARNAQTAADAAVRGASLSKQAGSSTWAADGKADAASNGFTDGSNGVTVSIVSPPTSGPYAGVTGAVQSLVSKTTSSIFMRIFQFPSASVSATAVTAAGTSKDCFYALDPSMPRSLQIGGGGSISLGCGVYVASSSCTAFNEDGGGSLSASEIDIVGSYTKAGNVCPTPTIGVQSQGDPLSSVKEPEFSSCDHTNWKMDGSTGSQTLNPGTYCGGISLSGGSLTATFNPGLYIVTGGLNWNSQVNVVGSGVTFYFTQGGGSGFGQVTISGQVNCSLTAPTSNSGGALTGILFFGDRAWNNTGQNVSINGGSSSKLEGIVYFPTTGVIVTGGTTCHGNYLGVVADNITVNGGASWTAPNPDYTALSGGCPFKGIGSGLVQ